MKWHEATEFANADFVILKVFKIWKITKWFVFKKKKDKQSLPRQNFADAK